VGIVGCEESIISLGNLKPLANLLSMPYVPIALPVVIPTKVTINFGKPMHFKGDVESESAIENKVEIVKSAISDLIQKGIAERKGWFR
jgi:hypothetical protein